MESVIDEIERAAVTLSVGTDRLRLLTGDEGQGVLQAVLDKFVTSGARTWWWEDFRMPATRANFEADDGWRHIATIAPREDELVWFIAEDSELPDYPVYETTPRTAVNIISECYHFEFYLVAKDLSWLLCESHHQMIYAIGEAVEERLRSHAV